MALVPAAEVPPNLSTLWNGVLAPETRVAGVTSFGDLILEASDKVQLLRLSWLEIEEIGTVLAEVMWQLEEPATRGAHWVYPSLLPLLPDRVPGEIYHFVQPLGLNGKETPDNVTLLPIAQAHSGMRSLWRQLRRAHRAAKRGR